jgi:integrase
MIQLRYLKHYGAESWVLVRERFPAIEDTLRNRAGCGRSSGITRKRGEQQGFNVRRGFIEQADFERLRSLATVLWLRLFLERAFQYGRRKQEFLGLRVRQVKVRTELIRLDVGTTKNGEGREVTMTRIIRELVRQAVAGKNSDDYLLTRADGAPVKDFRKVWKNLCEKARLDGLLIHDFRRSAGVNFAGRG